MLLYVLRWRSRPVVSPDRRPRHWTTTNIWTMGQQFYVIRRNPRARPHRSTQRFRPRQSQGKVDEIHEEAPTGVATAGPATARAAKKQTRAATEGGQPPPKSIRTSDNTEEGNMSDTGR
jgi:YidC/Oxa1 family membrane protein insertase